MAEPVDPGTYGGPNDKNTIKSDEVTKGKTLYSIIDIKTGAVTWYERKGVLGNISIGKDIKLGTREPGKKFIPYKDESLAGEQGFSESRHGCGGQTDALGIGASGEGASIGGGGMGSVVRQVQR